MARQQTSRVSPGKKKHERDEVEEFLSELFHTIWNFRTELVFLIPFGVLFWVLCTRVNVLVAVIVTISVVVGLCSWSVSRRWVGWQLERAHLRRSWLRAGTDAGLAVHDGRLPRVRKTVKTQAGAQLHIQVARGSSVSDVEKQSERIAAAMGLSGLRVERDDRHAGRAVVSLIQHDVFTKLGGQVWPFVRRQSCSLWDGIPVGVDENGQPVMVNLVERNLLIGGEPGAGKSVALSLLVAAGALDRNVKLWLFDGKVVELAAWRYLAERTVGADINQTITVLRELREEMEKRYQLLLDHGLRKIERSTGFPLHLVVIDELAFYMTTLDRKQRTEIHELLRDLVSRGRAAGVIVVAATQKPSSDVIPTSLRDLFGFRLAMRCNTKDASDTILGSGWATEGYNAATIPGDQRGTGYLLAEDKTPVKLRSYMLTDHTIDLIASRANRTRAITSEPLAEGAE